MDWHGDQEIKTLKAEIERLLAALEKEEKFTMAAMDKAKAYRAVVIHAAACNPEATGDNAAIALRQIVSHARKALVNQEDK